MKKLLLLFIIVFTSCSTYAQRWELFKNDISHYTTPQQNTAMAISFYTDSVALTLRVDTVLLGSHITTTVFAKDYSGRLTPFSRSCIGPSASILGDSLVENADSSIYYINNNKLIWKNKNQWKFFRDSNNNELLISLDSVTVLNGDSLKHFSFSSSSNVAFDSAVFTTPFIVSKLNGMVKGFDFSYFPSEIKPISYLLKGFVKKSNIYDYAIGDEYHYQHKLALSMSYSTLDLYVLKVIGKVVHNQDSVSYTFERKVREDKLVPMGQGLVHQYRSYKDTIIKSYNWSHKLLLGTYMDIRSLTTGTMNRGTVGVYDSDYAVPTFIDISEIGWSGDSICDFTFETERYTSYIFGVGSFDYYSNGDISSWYESKEDLLYYKKGTKTWGTPITIVISDIKENTLSNIYFYPNPAKDQFIIENIQEKTDYKLVNVNGAMIERGIFKEASNSISMSNLERGIYFLQLQSKSNFRTIRIVKQ